MIAERIGDSEAMDLFRHSTELGYHVSQLIPIHMIVGLGEATQLIILYPDVIID